MNPVVRPRTMFGLALPLVLGAVACAADTGTVSAGSPRDGSSGTGASTGSDASVGTGGSAAGTGGFTGSGGAVGTGGFGTGGSTGVGGASAGSGGVSGTGGVPGCFVTITPVSPPSFAQLESGPDVRLRVRATVANAGSGVPVWTWNVLFEDQSMIATTVIGGDPKIVEFPIERTGNYDITARVNTSVGCSVGEQFAMVKAPSPSLLFRVTPPPTTGYPIPPQDVKVPFTSAGPSTRMLNLVRGTMYSVAPQDQGRIFIPSYVRITGIGSGVAVEGFTASGPVSAFLLPSAVYDVLVIPDGPLAPKLFSAPSVPANPLMLDPGIPVTGTTLDGNGAPLAGVRIVLRDGARPSTVGISDFMGQFSLWSREGTLSAVMVPPPTSGLPEAHVSASPGIALDASANNLDLQMTWARITQAALSVTVETSDGSSPIAGASVRVDAELSSVGTLRAQSNSLTASPPVTGSVHVDAIADDAGVALFPHLPIGTYVVTAVPPVSLLASGMVLTTTSIDLTASGYTGELPLVRPVKLSGTLLPANTALGARVTATDKSAGIATETVSAIVGAGGAYKLAVAPGLGGRTRHYQLVADPPADAHLSRTVLGTVDVGAVDAPAGSLSMAPGVSFIGTVQSGASVIGGAYVQVFCSGPSTACLDPKTPVAETVTQQDGSFSVVVPVPATGP